MSAKGGQGPLAAHSHVPDDPHRQPTGPCPGPSEHVQVWGGAPQGSPQVGWIEGQGVTGRGKEQERWSSAPHAQEQPV